MYLDELCMIAQARRLDLRGMEEGGGVSHGLLRGISATSACSRSRCKFDASNQRNMNVIADRLFRMRMTFAMLSAWNASAVPSMRSSAGHWQNRSA